MRVKLVNHVQNVALLEADAQLAARDVGVVLGVVVDVSLKLRFLVRSDLKKRKEKSDLESLDRPRSLNCVIS